MMNIDHHQIHTIQENVNFQESTLSDSKRFANAIWINFIHKKSFIPNPQLKNKVKNLDYPTKRWGHSSTIYNKQMIIFGGRQSTKSLANIYSFDFDTNIWQKIEPLGQIPPARDSHSTILYKNELIVFGGSGSGKKLNDLWSFNIENKKWSKIIAHGEWPIPREGHSCSIIRNNYIMIYGGLDENDGLLDNMYLLDMRNSFWHKVESIGNKPSLRDSQTCTPINNVCYIFGGQGVNDALYNDLYSLTFSINETEKKFTADWRKEQVNGQSPPERTSHTCVSYKNEYLILIGGESFKEALNDVWALNILTKTWSEIQMTNKSIFESRLCHSCSVHSEKLYIFGGMKNSDITLDSLSILCLDGKHEELEQVKSIECVPNLSGKILI